jgi:O-methyltransferase
VFAKGDGKSLYEYTFIISGSRSSPVIHPLSYILGFFERQFWFRKSIYRPWAAKRAMQFPPFDVTTNESIMEYSDYHRFGAIAMALRRIDMENIPGALAEAGVFEGHASRFIHRLAPERRYYLFDTFEGFDKDDLDPEISEDKRFRSTSVDAVLHFIGDQRNLIVKKGRVPETFSGLESERFAFVLLDMDLYKPTLSALAFFYPRLSIGGYLMVHDYHNDESNWACRRAVDEFMQNKPERIIEIADIWGSVLFRKWVTIKE